MLWLVYRDGRVIEWTRAPGTPSSEAYTVRAGTADMAKALTPKRFLRSDAEIERSHQILNEIFTRTHERARAMAREAIDGEPELLRKFLEITYRKVTLRDEYGDENWDALDGEAKRVIAKLKSKQAFLQRWGDRLTADPNDQKLYFENNPGIDADMRVATESLRVFLRPNVEAALSEILSETFRAYYATQTTSGPTGECSTDVTSLGGEQYEAQVMEWLRMLGAEDIRGTPHSGDQGADVLFTYAGCRIAVQCKRYKDRVNNKAVQEVHAARSIYECTEAWVITTAMATPGAREAAQKTGVRLLERVASPAPIRDALCSLERPR